LGRWSTLLGPVTVPSAAVLFWPGLLYSLPHL
jgi:hypothetical protein